ncbi:MAG: pentapeptide repeat-containing protein [Dehalococcoidales bacterium]|nr:pentapeptide repeat-containing protein [Dehalococcoidales bacterium]
MIYKTLTTKRVKEIIELHGKWLRNELVGVCADLRGCNLRGCNLSFANLSDANLSNANLSYANLRGCNLSFANLSDANLSDANLSNANLSFANLSDANLSYANLSNANLSYANLRGCNLSFANLSDANLYGCNLSFANLSDANLSGCNLPAPTMFLLADWGEVSNLLTLELMRYDAENHPQPELFDGWAKGGRCPYDDIKWARCAVFAQKRELWKPGKCKMTALQLVEALFKEKGIKR